jgi:MYXO-CTERM domain-containing protein
MGVLYLSLLGCETRVRIIPEVEQTILYSKDLVGTDELRAGDPVLLGSEFCITGEEADSGLGCVEIEGDDDCVSVDALGEFVLDLDATACAFDDDRVVLTVVSWDELELRPWYGLEALIDAGIVEDLSYEMVGGEPGTLTPPVGEDLYVSDGPFTAEFRVYHPDHETAAAVQDGAHEPSGTGVDTLEVSTLRGQFQAEADSGRFEIEGKQTGWQRVDVAELSLHVARGTEEGHYTAPAYGYLEARDAEGHLVKGVEALWTVQSPEDFRVDHSSSDAQLAFVDGNCVALGEQARTGALTLLVEAQGRVLSRDLEVLIPAADEDYAGVSEDCQEERPGPSCGCSAATPASALLLSLLVGLLALRRRDPPTA